MLKTRNLVILAVILVILAGIRFMQKSSHQKSISGSAQEVILAGEFKKEDLGRITLGLGTDEEIVILSTSPTGWLVDTAFNTPASDQRIDALLRSLSNLAGEYRSDKAEVLGQYGLAEGAAVKIKGYDKQGQEVLAVDIGKTPERFPGQFVRLPGQNKVYLTQKGVLGNLGIYGEPQAPTSKHFLELQALKEDRLDVDRILLSDGTSTLDLRKEFALEALPEDAPEGTEPEVDRLTWEWQLGDDPATALAKTKVDAVLGAAVSIRAIDVADPAASLADYGLDNPTRKVTLQLQDGTTRELAFGASRPAEGAQQAGTYLKIEGKDQIWVVTDYTLKNLFKTLEDLQP